MTFKRHAMQGTGLSAWLALGTAFLASGFHPAQAATLPAGFKETKLIGSLNPSCVDVAPDGRVFLCEKNGRIRVYKDGQWLAAPLLTVDADFQEERGLLGLALDPDFKSNPFVYIYYTAKNPSHNRISRFRIAGDVATGSESVLLDLNTLGALRAGGWHNGGSIRFGKDGKLYIATGNNAVQAYSQSMDNLLGKVLRINSDGSIPNDNPWYATNTGNNRAIWALGLRNPYVTDVHPVTGRYLVHDVGDGSSEEINEGKAGINFGYPKSEGNAGTPPTGLTGTYANPVSNYGHGNGCAITGGSFYQPASNTFGPEYAGLYFFSDYCNGWIKSLDPANGTVKNFATNIPRPIYLKGAQDGSLYYVARGAKAAGLASGSAEDNASTTDGSLFRITGPIPTSTARLRGEQGLVPAFLAQGKVRMPQGKSQVVLLDLAGHQVWEYRGLPAEASTWLDLPANLPKGIFKARYK